MGRSVHAWDLNSVIGLERTLTKWTKKSQLLVCVCVCVYERERERERETVCVREKERKMFVYNEVNKR